MQRLWLLVWLLSTTLTTFSQHSPDIDFGKIAPSSLEMTHYPLDSTANAVVLGDYGRSHFAYNENAGLHIVFTRHTRIKILNSDGYDHATVSVSLYRQGNDQEELSRLKGYTYNLEGGKVVKTKLKAKSKFEEQYNDNFNQVRFTMPNVKAGSVIEYSYRVTSEFLFNLHDWEFQRSIPTAWSEYRVEIPEYFRYQQLSRGYHPMAINETSSSSGSFQFSHKERTNQNYVTQTTTSQSSLNFTQQVFRWAAQDVPALVEEPYITAMSDYTSKILFELSSINIPGQQFEDYSSTWAQIDQELLAHEHFGKLLKPTAAVKKVVASVIADATSEEDKMVRLFNYVRDHIKWNEEARLIGSQSLKQTLSEGAGNSADINLLLAAMLREAGVSVDPVALSTRDHGIILEPFPRFNQFNYVIACARIDSTMQLLDATRPLYPYNLLPPACLNQSGRMISARQPGQWIPLQPAHASTQMTTAKLTLTNEQLLGTIERAHSHYLAARLRRKVADFSSTDRYIGDVQESQSGVQQYNISGVDALDQSLKESLEVTLTDGLQVAGNLVYLNPFTDAIAENPFRAEKRMYPVDYTYPTREIYMLNFTVPEGYVVDELPADLRIALPDQGGSYRFGITQQGNTLQLISKLNIDRTQFYAPEYTALREFYRQMIEKQQEQIVLVKQ